ncbi:MAG: CRISPR-associated protein Cas4 [Oscillospiraceae bacterium]|nr:CRISPR-associated protein Cas4 [Oscillospiraceae bacterium]
MSAAAESYGEDDYLLLSGIHQFAFCRRRWALIYVEQQREDNWRTVDGSLFHKRAHDPFFTEKRRDVIITREMAVRSRALGITGQCDIVEFLRDDERGVPLSGRTGNWHPRPVEYKRGKRQENDSDRLQLCAQAMCLEEMLACQPIEQGCLYYGETKRREYVDLTDELRDTARKMFAEMHEYFRRGYTPRVKPGRSCRACSLCDICIPKLPVEHSVRKYIKDMMEDIPGV